MDIPQNLIMVEQSISGHVCAISYHVKDTPRAVGVIIRWRRLNLLTKEESNLITNGMGTIHKQWLYGRTSDDSISGPPR